MGGTLSRVLIRHGGGVVGRKAIKDTTRLHHDLMALDASLGANSLTMYLE